PEVSVGNTGLDPDVVADAIASDETVKDLSALAGSMANDDSVITDAVVKAAATTLETDEVTITVETYLEVRVESVTTKENGIVEMTLEITPKYNLVAEAEGKAPVKVAEGQTMEVAKGEVITLVVPVPDSFTEGSKLYVRHVKSNGKVYMYETTVANGKATFENPNGFSTFVLTTAAPAAKIGEVGYVTLAEAVADVENGQTIVLQKDCDETVTVSRDVTFTLDVNDKTFDGAIEAGANTTVTVEDGKYTFDYTAPAKKSTTKKYDVVVKSDDHGKATVNDTYAKCGQEITITVTPDKGYELDKLTVIDAKGNEIDVEKTKNGKYTFVMPKADVTVKASFEKEVDAEAPAVEDVTSADADKTTLVLTIDQRIYKLDGNYVVNDVAPVIADARTFLPIRLVAEALGATVEWDEAAQSVTIVDADTTIVIYIGQAYATVNGVPVQLDAPAFIANGRTYLPVRFVAENLGATVSWDADTQEVTIVG
ncbi:MAG: copper amine oxidase N-terminal domain-containing protein, partial [Anaerotignum sp.]|nr:copper amine oxidase N-terminal domain-containing protein [Anaerotignum sp.]